MNAVEEALRRVDAKKREIDGARPLPAETLQSLHVFIRPGGVG